MNLAESGGTLAGTSQAAAQQGATLSLVDSEFLAYETATLVSGYAYNLTGLARGQGGSAATAHSSGASFARVDGAVIRYTLPGNFAGLTLYFKFQSFNVFGGGAEDLPVPSQSSSTLSSDGGGRRSDLRPITDRIRARSRASDRRANSGG